MSDLRLSGSIIRIYRNLLQESGELIAKSAGFQLIQMRCKDTSVPP